jgi:hypothetical protein
MALLRVSAYNVGTQQRQVSGNNKLEEPPSLVSLFLCELACLHSVWKLFRMGCVVCVMDGWSNDIP